MTKLASLVGVAAIAGAMVLGNATDAAAEKITAQQLSDLTVGNTVFGKTDSGVRFKVLNTPDGRIVLNMENGFYDEGKWEVKDGKKCVQWKKIRKGKYYCTRDFELDGDMYTLFNEAIGKRQGPNRIHKGTAAGFEDVM